VSRVLRLADEDPVFEAGGATTRAILGDGAMLNLTELAPGAEIEHHSHPHEQVGIVLAGSITLTVESEVHELGAGCAYQLTGGAVHALKAGAEGARLVDTFNPIREDYRA
jgi:quercetin dioxygenase-like cupin family protein